jgi:aryl-alcohol dehydrogenase-like predicted oxidoreductase
MPSSDNAPTSRRDLLKLSAAAAAALAAAHLGLAQAADPATPADHAELPPAPETIWKGDMPYRKFGKTDELVSLLGLGGFHIGNLPDQDACAKHIRSAIDRGITFMDNCWSYHNGKSETWMGHALTGGYRDKVFLMTKIDSHTKSGAARQIDECLKRLQTDRVDLMQHHEVIRPTDPDKIFADGAAHEAMLEAQKAGKIRHIGFTGHKDPAIHLAMVAACRKHNYPLAAAQMPVNLLDAHYKSFTHQVLPVLARHGIAPLAMKTLAAGGIVKNKFATATECLHYAMTLPTTTVITGMDSAAILDQGINAARTFKPLSKDQIVALLDRTRPMSADGKYEAFKTTANFDGTVKNPDWLS